MADGPAHPWQTPPEQVGNGDDGRLDTRSWRFRVILIVLRAKIRPEKHDEWLAGIRQYTADVRSEPGNVSFDYFENGDDPNEFAMIEVFADSAAGAAHVATDHGTKFFAWMPAMVSERPRINYQELDGEAWSEMAEVTPE
jgi:quinol monooxygenase YgiN